MEGSWQATLAAGEVLVLDGGMGTELQHRGVPMDEVVWSGVAVLSHPNVVRAVHEDYIRAGADVKNKIIPALGRAALLQNKRATGRSKDLVDVEILEQQEKRSHKRKGRTR